MPFQKVFYKAGKSKKIKEEIEQYRRQEGIEIKDKIEVPNPFIDWSDTHFPDYIMKSIVEQNFAKPSPIQAQGNIYP